MEVSIRHLLGGGAIGGVQRPLFTVFRIWGDVSAVSSPGIGGKGFPVHTRVTFGPGNSKIVVLVPRAEPAHINKDEGMCTDSSVAKRVGKLKGLEEGAR